MDATLQLTTRAILTGFLMISFWGVPKNGEPAPLGPDTGTMCVVDMGSNNFKLILGEMSAGTYTQRYFEKRTLGVGDEVSKTGRLSDQKLLEIEKTLADFKSLCESKRAVSVGAIATAAFREAKNGREVLEIGKRVRIPVEIASEERESRLAYLTATNGVGNRTVIDNGSRTIELVSRSLDDAPFWRVVTLGYRTAYDRFFRDARTFADARDKMVAALAHDFGDLRSFQGRQDFLGIELDEMAAYLLNTEQVDGARIDRSFLSKEIEKLRGQTAEQFSALKRVSEIDRVLPRMVALEYILENAGYQSVLVVGRELGAGLIIEAGLKK